MFEKIVKKRRLLCPEITGVGASSFAQQDIFNSNNRIKTAAQISLARISHLYAKHSSRFKIGVLFVHQALKSELLWGDR